MKFDLKDIFLYICVVCIFGSIFYLYCLEVSDDNAEIEYLTSFNSDILNEMFILDKSNLNLSKENKILSDKIILLEQKTALQFEIIGYYSKQEVSYYESYDEIVDLYFKQREETQNMRFEFTLCNVGLNYDGTLK